jgi:hypothetical protein
MSLILFVISIFISFVVVRIGGIALELTGIEWSLAKFQALSLFTGTGFTTRESELIAATPQRRRIATVLMVLGSAGLVTLIAALANSIRSPEALGQLTIPFLDLVFPSYLLPLINLAVIVLAVAIAYKAFAWAHRSGRLTNFIRRRLLKRGVVRPVNYEELLVATGGYGISKVDVLAGNPHVGLELRQTNLRQRDITVLAIERDQGLLPNPGAATVIEVGDQLVCFGRLGRIKDELGADRPQEDGAAPG